MSEVASSETAVLDEIVRRIVEAVDPDRIILFGSRARGEAHPDSDYDILIMAPSPLPRWKRTGHLYFLLRDTGASKDIVWWTAEEAGKWGNVNSHFITTAIREGKVLYERAA